MQMVMLVGGLALLAVAVFALLALRRRFAPDTAAGEMKDFGIQVAVCLLIVVGGIGVTLITKGYTGGFSPTQAAAPAVAKK